MEPQFKTSFIPKQTLAKEAAPTRRRGGGIPKGIGFIIGLVIFLATAGTAASFFLYKQYLLQSIDEKTADLARAREAFQPALLLDLARLDTRLSAARDLVGQHTAPSVVFTLLEQTTLKSVQYNSMSISFDSEGAAQLDMSGKAATFSGVALQSDVLGSNQYIRDLVVSDLANAEDNSATFNVSAKLDPRLLLYERTLSGSQGGS